MNDPAEPIVADLHKAKAACGALCTINPHPRVARAPRRRASLFRFVQMMRTLVQPRDSSIILTHAPRAVCRDPLPFATCGADI